MPSSSRVVPAPWSSTTRAWPQTDMRPILRSTTPLRAISAFGRARGGGIPGSRRPRSRPLAGRGRAIAAASRWAPRGSAVRGHTGSNLGFGWLWLAPGWCTANSVWASTSAAARAKARSFAERFAVSQINAVSDGGRSLIGTNVVSGCRQSSASDWTVAWTNSPRATRSLVSSTVVVGTGCSRLPDGETGDERVNHLARIGRWVVDQAVGEVLDAQSLRGNPRIAVLQPVYPASMPEPKGGAQCVRRARWDLRGGAPATAVPTATLKPHGDGGHSSGLPHCRAALALPFGRSEFIVAGKTSTAPASRERRFPGRRSSPCEGVGMWGTTASAPCRDHRP
jgi:hypothetical protein